MNYFDKLNDEVKAYFKILSPVFPEWLIDYINTKEMQRLENISLSCGMDYTNCFNIRYWYSNLDHSIGVALIVWNFTHDKKQTLAALFHDIASPTFKHCIDFMNGDSETQESTEEKTEEIIRNSKEIMELLNIDNIKVEEVSDYHIYPIADNNTPRLSADRFEYTFSSGLIFHRIWEVDKIKHIYDNIVILKNEDGIEELGFKDYRVCEEYIDIIHKIWPEWVSDKDRTCMQFLADIVTSMYIKGYITIDDLYVLSENEVIDKILNCDDSYIQNAFKQFQNANNVFSSDNYIEDKYCISVKSKTRYIVPLTIYEDKIVRINEVSEQSKQQIDNYLNMKFSKYTGFNFEFKPYQKKKLQ